MIRINKDSIIYDICNNPCTILPVNIYPNLIGVKFKTYNPSRHSCGNRCEHGYGWYYRKSQLFYKCKKGMMIPLTELKLEF